MTPPGRGSGVKLAVQFRKRLKLSLLPFYCFRESSLTGESVGIPYGSDFSAYPL